MAQKAAIRGRKIKNDNMKIKISNKDIRKAEETNKLKKYEYKCVLILGAGGRTTRVLNSYGQEGWELVSTYWAWHYFKRPIE